MGQWWAGPHLDQNYVVMYPSYPLLKPKSHTQTPPPKGSQVAQKVRAFAMKSGNLRCIPRRENQLPKVIL